MPVSDLRFTVNIGNKHRREDLEGRPHLVVPCTMLGEAVVSGSEGPVFYPKAVNAESTDAWNGHPIVVYHPKLNNKFVSARSPAFFNSRKVGTIFNTKHDDKLRTECWFDEEKTKKIDNRIYEAIIQNQGMEVSTGVGVDWKPEEGEHEGVKYTKRAEKLLPDHLAVLPDQIGAFSRAMGGGLFANMACEPESLQMILTAAARNVLSRCGVELVGNELSFSEVSRALAELLGSTYGEKGEYWRGWIEAVYSDYVVYYDKDKCFKVGYKQTDNEVSLSGTPTEVTRVTSYETVSNQAKEPEPMSFDKKKHVADLISNGQLEESQRSVFEAMEENVLKAMKIVEKTSAPVVGNATPVTSAPVVPAVTPPVPTPPKPVTVNEWLQDPTVPLPVRQAAQRQMAQDAAYKDGLVQTILTANTNHGFTKEFLDTKEIPELEGWARAFQSAQPAGVPMFQTGYAPQVGAFRGAVGAPPFVGNSNVALESPLGVKELDFSDRVGKKD